MQNPMAAIRTGRVRPRYATVQPRRRERQLGLLRRARVSAAVAHGSAMQVRPRDAVRHAARSITRVQASASRAGTVRRSGGMMWSRRDEAGLRVVRLRIAAPWRG